MVYDDVILLKYACISPSYDYINDLLLNDWDTRPGMDIRWIIKNIDNLYILIEEDDDYNQKMIGFSVFDEDKNIYYFEIIKKYRNAGYGTRFILKILDKFNVERVVEVSNDSFGFWEKFFDHEDIFKS
jgi:RimJ/RimL family protein N-acetyltransferase